jgi:hypothetical protein
MANWWDKNLTDKQKFRLQEPKDPSLLDVVSTVPNPVGDVASGLLAAQDFSKGNYGSAALNSLGLLPFIPSMGAITTWHGSPNIFDKFDTSKIKNMASNGQSYGYGHYLAEKDNVAKGYQPRDPAYENKLSKLYNNAEKQQNYPAMEIYERYMGHDTPDDISKILNDKDSLSGYSVTDIKKMQQANNLAAKEYQKQKSSLYKVDLPDEYLPKMLQWDKPLSEHPTDIQKALQPIIANTKKSFPNMIDDPTGSSIYQLYSQYRGGNPDFASKSLLEAGIPGIKYFDDFSGGSGKGSHNYVVFDDNILKILERNSKPIK